MSAFAMVTAAWLLCLWALIVVCGLWLLTARKADRLEDLIVELLRPYQLRPETVQAIIDGELQLEMPGGDG